MAWYSCLVTLSSLFWTVLCADQHDMLSALCSEGMSDNQHRGKAAKKWSAGVESTHLAKHAFWAVAATPVLQQLHAHILRVSKTSRCFLHMC